MIGISWVFPGIPGKLDFGYPHLHPARTGLLFPSYERYSANISRGLGGHGAFYRSGSGDPFCLRQGLLFTSPHSRGSGFSSF